MIVIVLDFITGEVHFHEIPTDIHNVEDDLHRWGYDLSNIQYMVTRKHKIKIQELL